MEYSAIARRPNSMSGSRSTGGRTRRQSAANIPIEIVDDDGTGSRVNYRTPAQANHRRNDIAHGDEKLTSGRSRHRTGHSQTRSSERRVKHDVDYIDADNSSINTSASLSRRRRPDHLLLRLATVLICLAAILFVVSLLIPKRNRLEEATDIAQRLVLEQYGAVVCYGTKYTPLSDANLLERLASETNSLWPDLNKTAVLRNLRKRTSIVLERNGAWVAADDALARRPWMCVCREYVWLPLTLIWKLLQAVASFVIHEWQTTLLLLTLYALIELYRKRKMAVSMREYMTKQLVKVLHKQQQKNVHELPLEKVQELLFQSIEEISKSHVWSASKMWRDYEATCGILKKAGAPDKVTWDREKIEELSKTTDMQPPDVDPLFFSAFKRFFSRSRVTPDAESARRILDYQAE